MRTPGWVQGWGTLETPLSKTNDSYLGENNSCDAREYLLLLDCCLRCVPCFMHAMFRHELLPGSKHAWVCEVHQSMELPCRRFRAW